MAAVAQGCARETGAREVLVMLDARLSEVYCAHYRQDASGTVKGVSEEQLLSPAQAHVLMPSDAPFTVTGSGLAEYLAIIQPQLPQQASLDQTRWPHAEDLLSLARGELSTGPWQPPESALPIYIRDRVALTEAERKSTLKPKS